MMGGGVIKKWSMVGVKRLKNNHYNSNVNYVFATLGIRQRGKADQIKLHNVRGETKGKLEGYF